MGTNCSCLRGGITEEKQVKLDRFGLEMEKDSNYIKEISLKQSSPNDTDLERILKLQSILRGFIARKESKKAFHFTQELSAFRQHPVQESNLHFTKEESHDEEIVRTELKEIPESRVPDYSTSATRAVQARLGKFVFQDSLHDNSVRLKRGPVEMENGAIFTGEWNNDNHRHGFGIQVWIDGSKFEGQWKNDKANG